MAFPEIGNVAGAHDSKVFVATDGMSGSPVVAPALSTQLMASSKLASRNMPVPTSARSFSHALMMLFLASLGFSFES